MPFSKAKIFKLHRRNNVYLNIVKTVPCKISYKSKARKSRSILTSYKSKDITILNLIGQII